METKTAYACGVDFQHDIEDASIRIYPSVEALKKNRVCYHECGIVRLLVTLEEWIEPQDFSYRKK